MCGIVGFINGDVSFTSGDDVFTELLFVDQLRGWDSTGVMILPNKGSPFVFKKGFDAGSFISLRTYQKHVYPGLRTARVAIGHNRAATKGSVCDANAHPFKVGDFTVVHNGHISNANLLLPGNETVEVDSMVIPRMFDEKGEHDGLECLDGGFALAWYNEGDNTFNLARNEQRPMTFCYLKGKNTLVFASEYTMALAVLDRNNLTVDGKFFSLTPGQHHKFNVLNPREEYKKFPFEYARKTTVTRYVGGTSTSPSTTVWGDLRGQQTKLASGNTGGTTGATATGVHAGPSEGLSNSPGEGLPTFIGHKTIQFKTISDSLPPKLRTGQGWAFGIKRIRKAAQVALRSGSYLGQNVVVTLDKFEPFTKNQIRGRGFGYKATAKGRVPCNFLNITEEEFTSWGGAGAMVNARVINAKEDKNIPGFVLGSVLIVAKHDEPVVARAVYPGFNGVSLNTREWLNAVKHGCAGCGELIYSTDADIIMWVGSESPICPNCVKDHDKMENLGLVQTH